MMPAARDAHTGPGSGALGLGAWAALGLLLVATAALRWRLLEVPLERDEGEYAYAARLLLDGIPPYAELYSMKLPGIFAAYAGVLALFGESVRGIHLGLLAVHAATLVLIFLLGRRLHGPGVGLVAALAFAALGLGQAIRGTFANAEHFVLLPALAGLVLLLRGLERGRVAELGASGLLLGAAFVVKQHGACFALAGGAYALFVLARAGRGRALAGLAAFAAGLALPYLATLAALARAGVFESFWFWTVRYPAFYVGQIGLAEAASRFAEASARVLGAAPLLWVTAGVGLGALCFERSLRGRRAFTALLAAASLLAIVPGFYFRTHYYLLLLPAASLLAGLGVRAAARSLPARTPAALRVALVGLVVALPVVQTLGLQRNFLFAYTPFQVARSTYALNPFADSPAIAEFVAERTRPGDRIAVLGSEPQLYFYAGRRAATGFVYMYPLSEEHPFAPELQERLIREIEAGAPELVLFVRSPPSWGRTGPPPPVLEWFRRYRAGYAPIAVVEPEWQGTRFHTEGPFGPGLGGPAAIEIWQRRP
jgi:hypothetical protein